MNATKYYVSTCRLVVQANPGNVDSWQDLYRVLPMLRNSLSCTVCQGLLNEPYTPEETSCQHHVCKGCRGGTKSLRPSCSWCKDYAKYSENVQLRILIQSYRKLCALIKVTSLYSLFSRNKEHGHNMIDIIRESEASQTSTLTERCGDFSEVHIKQERIEEEGESAGLPDTPDRTEESEISVRLRGGRLDSDRRSVEDQTPQTPGKSEDKPPEFNSMINPIVPDEIFSSPSAKGLNQVEEPPYKILKTEEMEVEEESLEHVKEEFDQLVREDSSGNWIIESSPYIPVDGVKSEYFPTPSNTPQYSVSRSETPSPPNPLRFAHSPTAPVSSSVSVVVSQPVLVDSRPGTKVRESFILQPRTEIQGCADDRIPATSRINLGWGSTTGRKLSSGTVVNLTPLILPRNTSATTEPRSLLKPQDDNSDVKNKAKKLGCRCGNATACPGKLTCCGQRCPCYVSRLACLNCKCKGCNNPNLPGGGKVLSYLNASLRMEAPTGGSRSGSPGVRAKSRTAPTSLVTGAASTVVRVPSANSDDADSMTDVDINTIPVVNLSSPASYRTFIGPSPLVQKISLPSCQSTSSTSVTANSPSRVAVVPVSSLSTVSVVPVSSLSTVSVVPVSSASVAAGSSLSTVSVVSGSSLSTVSIPLSSFASGLKLRPVDQLQRREIKARVIPTSFRLKAAPYTRLPLNGKINGTNGVRLQTMSLVSLLKNSKNGTPTIQVLNKPDDQNDISIDI